MLRSKEPLCKVSRLSLPTQIFGINEPIFFGFPIVLNPIFMIPYVVTALVLTPALSAHELGVIQKPFVPCPGRRRPIVGNTWCRAATGERLHGARSRS